MAVAGILWNVTSFLGTVGFFANKSADDKKYENLFGVAELNMDLVSFNNSFKQLFSYVFLEGNQILPR